ncbi:hypothetical protein P8452_34084 [Trifolium repens]|nr:hypothetical protein P8452_34084 [Trifolium repens]
MRTCVRNRLILTKDQVDSSPLYGGLRRRIGRIVKLEKLSSRFLGKKDDGGEDNSFMEERFQDKDKKNKLHLTFGFFRSFLS